jgi:hypothetical protein
VPATVQPTGTGRMAGVVLYDALGHIDKDADAWAKACFADYEDLRKVWAPYDAKYRARFEEIKKITNYYEMREALDKLVDAYKADLKATKLYSEGASANADLLAASGLPYEAVAYVSALHRKRGIPFRYTKFWASFPVISDDTLAGDFYCTRATVTGTHRTGVQTWLHFTQMLPEARRKAVSAYLDSLEETVQRDTAVANGKGKALNDNEIGQHVQFGLPIPADSDVGLAGSVGSITPTSHGVELWVLTGGAWGDSHDCHTSNKIDSITQDGQLHHPTFCQIDSHSLAEIYKVTFPDVPKALKKGDTIYFSGTLKAKPEIAKDRSKVTLDVAGVFVNKIARSKNKGEDVEEIAHYD